MYGHLHHNLTNNLQSNIEFSNIKAINVSGNLKRNTIVGENHKIAIITLANIWFKTSIPLVTK
ncbi:hypothetical protein [Spiroplasma endosymbiont of Polydrusus formosus]|uniref:hypothetical protein n=1 Tax=Spiroplasma endosymbiont of Polydrusus formosus TaxID=3139326 RepID=UPI0035B5233B